MGKFTRIRCLVECNRCGNPIYLRRSEAIKNAKWNFCDRECYYARKSKIVNDPETNLKLIQSGLRVRGHDPNAVIECYCCGRKGGIISELGKTRLTHDWSANRDKDGKVLNYLARSCYCRLYYSLHRDRILAAKRKLYVKHLIRPTREYNYALVFKRNARLREKIFHILGHVCARCGQWDKRLLQFDHINGRGKLERRLKRHGHAYLKSLLIDPEETKKKVQILCANCNWLKRYEKQEMFVIVK